MGTHAWQRRLLLWGIVLLTALLSASGPVQADLVFWNKLGSQAEVESSELGPDGAFTAGAFVPGVFGTAYQAADGITGGVAFPETAIPGSGVGCMELWAKLDDVPGGTIGNGGRPLFVQISDGSTSYSFRFTGNDGLGGGGMSGAAGQTYVASTGSFGSYTWEGILGTGRAEAWHHYALVWDQSGIAGVDNGSRKVAIYLDGVLQSARWYTFQDNGFPALGVSSLEVVAGNAESGLDVTVDNLKIWDHAKTDFSDRFLEGDAVTPTQLVLWNTLDDTAAVEDSEVGVGGTVFGSNAGYEAAQHDTGYVRLATGNESLQFPGAVLHALNERGAIELWINPKVTNPVAFDYGAFGLIGQPYFGGAAPDERGNVYLFWGDGVSGQGLYGGVRFDGTLAGTPSEAVQFVAEIGTPFHTAIVWDIAGIDAGSDTVRVYRDGTVVGSTTGTWNTAGTDLEEFFWLGVSPDSQGYDKWISDNIKVWNYAKTDFSDRFLESPQEASVTVTQPEPAEGSTVAACVHIDMGASGQSLGSHGATLAWDPAVLQYSSHSGGDSPFDTPTVNTDNVSTGSLAFADADVTGASGNVLVFCTELDVIGAAGTSTTIDLDLTSGYTAATFLDILPTTAVNDVDIDVVLECTIGDVNGDDAINSGDALVILTDEVELPIPAAFATRLAARCGETDENGATDSTDALVILSFEVGLDTSSTAVNTSNTTVEDCAGCAGGGAGGGGAAPACQSARINLRSARATTSVNAEITSPSWRVRPGESFEASVLVAVRGGKARLGSLTGHVEWDPESMELLAAGGGSHPIFHAPVVGLANASAGRIVFTQAEPQGAVGKVELLRLRFRALRPLRRPTKDLELRFSAMSGTSPAFGDLLPALRVNSLRRSRR